MADIQIVVASCQLLCICLLESMDAYAVASKTSPPWRFAGQKRPANVSALCHLH